MFTGYKILSAAVRDVFGNLGAVFKTLAVPVVLFGVMLSFLMDFFYNFRDPNEFVFLSLAMFFMATVFTTSVLVKWSGFILDHKRPPWVLGWNSQGDLWRTYWRIVVGLFVSFLMVALSAEPISSVIYAKFSNALPFFLQRQIKAFIFGVVTCFFVLLLCARLAGAATKRMSRSQRLPFLRVFSMFGGICFLAIALAFGFGFSLVSVLSDEFWFQLIAIKMGLDPSSLLFFTQILQLCWFLTMVMLTIAVIVRIFVHLKPTSDIEDVFG